MVQSVRISFDKIYHDTGRAILVKIHQAEYWIPKKLCRNLVINKKLGGNVCIPSFFAEKIGLNITDEDTEKTVLHHIPEQKQETVTHDKDLFK